MQPGHALRRRRPRHATDLAGYARAHGYGVGPRQDVWVKQREQRLEVSAARGSQECVDNCPLAGKIGVGNRGRTLRSAPRAARELPSSGR